ncbi:MAG: hypothetical protein BGO77_05210 [Caedibacter sp. 37-49]|nr:MAG: hypothetical protein BGO77_05210 [Caedibacter sp. 37-49]
MKSEVRIYKPKKTAMQSGLRRTHEWVLEYIRPSHLYVDPLMQWTGCVKTNAVQPKLFFKTREKAIEYAQSNNLTYLVENPHPSKVMPKRYSDNFTNIKKL